MKNSNYQGLTSHVLEFIFFDEHVLKSVFEYALVSFKLNMIWKFFFVFLITWYKFLFEHVFGKLNNAAFDGELD